VALALVLLAGGCGGGSASSAGSAGRCPKPIIYDEATLKAISAALKALPPDNILHQAMTDYETERDDLRFCR